MSVHKTITSKQQCACLLVALVTQQHVAASPNA